MNKRLISFVKYNKFILALYRGIGNLGVGLLKLVTPKNKKLILFMSYGGQKYDDSPKALFEVMKNDPFFSDYRIVWAFINPLDQPEIGCEKIRTDSLKFYHMAISAKLWIHNSSMERGLKLKKKGTFEFNTNHGTPLKLWGKDVPNAPYSAKFSKIKDIRYCSQSVYDRDTIAHCLCAEKSQFLLSGLPRNDSLYSYSEKDVTDIKDRIGIPKDKKIILYAPTFREYERDEHNGCFLKPPIDVKKWKSELGEKYVVLFRAHYEVINVLEIKNDGFFFNVSNYPSINDLYIISDMLISDYSSVYFDYSILDRPMFCFAYDYDIYRKKRGLYLDLEKDFPCNLNRSEDELLDDIKKCDIINATERTKVFHHKYATYSGNASKMVIEFIKEGIRQDNW